MDDFQTLTPKASIFAMAKKLTMAVGEMTEEMALKDQRIRELEQELQALRNDSWTSRVTYENVVEMIALNEDAAVRDEMRKVFEPLLKKAQVQQLRCDIKRKVKELESADGVDNARTFNNYGTYTEVQAGGRAVINKFMNTRIGR